MSKKIQLCISYLVFVGVRSVSLQEKRKGHKSVVVREDEREGKPRNCCITLSIALRRVLSEVAWSRIDRAKRTRIGGYPPLLLPLWLAACLLSVCARLVDSLTPDGSTVTSKSELSCVSGACGTSNSAIPAFTLYDTQHTVLLYLYIIVYTAWIISVYMCIDILHKRVGRANKGVAGVRSCATC